MPLQTATFIGPPDNNPQELIGAVKAGLNATIGSDGSLNYVPATPLLGGTIPAGSNMYFNQPSAPTGWVKRGDVNDATIRLVTQTPGGLQGNGGNFSTIFVSNVVTAATGSVTWTGQQTQGTSLTQSTTPQHVHSIVAIDGRNQAVEGGGSSQRADNPTSNTSTTTGSSSAHVHSTAGMVGTGSFTANFAVKYVDFILAQKVQ